MNGSIKLWRIAFIFFFSPVLGLASPGEAELVAASLTGEEISIWLEKLPGRPASIGIFGIQVSAPLEQGYSSVLEAEILKYTKERKLIQVMSCLECRSTQTKVEGDHLIVTKGAPNIENLRELGKKYGTEAFLSLEVFRTAFSVFTQVTLYQASNGEIIAVERFKVPAFELSHRAMQFLLVGGPGRTFGYAPTQTEDSIPYSINLLALEELGFGKGGLAVGGIFAHDAGNLGYIAPTLGVRSRFGATTISSLASVSTGFGFTGEKGGVAVRAAYDLFIGTFTVVGVHGVYLFSVKGVATPEKDTLSGYAGLHIGLALGR